MLDAEGAIQLLLTAHHLCMLDIKAMEVCAFTQTQSVALPELVKHP